jgi:alpha-tubulin suppressor-like RCC1 family protein
MLKIPHVIAFFVLVFAPGAVGQQGSIVSWGDDTYGQISSTPSSTDFIQVASGHLHSLALKADGSIVSWGHDQYGQVSNTPPGTGFIQVAGGSNGSLALKADGSIISWGLDQFGQVSNTPSGTDFIQISGGSNHSLALKSDGSIVSWGLDTDWVISNTPSGTDFIQVSGGGDHSLALKSDGSIVSWGNSSYGLGSGTPSGTDFIQVDCGRHHSLAIKTDGSLVAWGWDWGGEVSGTPSGTDFQQVDGGQHFSLALKNDGSLVAWGYDNYGQVSSTPTGANFAQIAAGDRHSVALLGYDSDLDGLADHWEDVNENGIVDPGETDPFDQDSDDDGLGDGEEVNTLRTDTRWIQSPAGDFYRLATADTWSQARAAAVAQGYDLTSIQDQAEADWLYSTFGDINDGFWIGLNDFSGVFEWSDGSPVNYTQWATGEPNTTFVAAIVGGPPAGEPGNWYGVFAGYIPRLAVWESPGPNAPQTALDPLAWDTDGDGLGDGQEDGIDAIYWDGFGIAGVTGTDPLVFVPDADSLTTTDPLDLDSDEDGIADGVEDIDGDGVTAGSETNPTLADSDGDTLPDGLELGLTSAALDTDGNVFVPDADPLTTTNPLEADTDSGGVDDGIEDQNGDGAINTWETDPNQVADDDFAFYVTNLTPGGVIHFKVYNASPNMVIVPAFSLTGAGPTMTTLGINVALSMPIKVLPPTLSNNQGTASWNGPRVPNSAQLGFSVYIQAVEVPVSSQQQPRTSNSVLLPVGAN